MFYILIIIIIFLMDNFKISLKKEKVQEVQDKRKERRKEKKRGKKGQAPPKNHYMVVSLLPLPRYNEFLCTPLLA